MSERERCPDCGHFVDLAEAYDDCDTCHSRAFADKIRDLESRLDSPTLVELGELDCVELDSRFGGWMADHHPLGLRGRGATPQAAVDDLRAKMRGEGE